MVAETGSDELSDTAEGEHNRLQRLGKYRILKRIGAGGMGTVFLAVDDSLNRTVALKVLPRDRAENPTLVRRFKAEGQVAAHMEHPNIVRVFEAGEADGFLYMALEYVEGIDVYELVERRGVVPVKRSTDIIKQTTSALLHAWEKGIVHRDIKPSNLLIKRDGSVKLADMGLARSVDETLETNITRAGTTVGTVDYMSPEQARSSKSADIRSDIYSLGCTWYHMLTGHPPFYEGSMTNKLQNHATSPRPDPRAENDRVPEGIVAIIQRMMARKPEDRYQTPQELLDDLEAASHMRRNVDESTLAALAAEAEMEEAASEDSEEVILMPDVDDLDLSKLSESADFVVSEPKQKRKPLKPKKRPKADKQASVRPPSTAVAPVAEEAPENEDSPDASKRAFPPIEETPAKKPQSAPRQPPSPETEPEPSRRKTRPQRASVKGEADGRKSLRQSKRGAAKAAADNARSLPPLDPAQPVDASAGSGFDLESLKFIIPALLAIIALAGIGFALYSNSDGLGTVGGPNPYVDEPASDGETRPAPDQPQAMGQPAPTDPESPPPDDASPQVVAATFPGAEGASRPAADQQPLIPDWVEAFRHPAAEAERKVVVRRRPTEDNQAAGIAEAIQMLPPAGGVIELAGDGPFRLAGMTVADRRRIRIQAADGTRPVIQLRPADDWSSGPLLSFRGARVEFEGVHFVLVDAGPAGADVVNIQQGDFAFRNGSITFDRRQDDALTALHVVGGVPRPGAAPLGKCLLENVAIRGSNLTALALSGSFADVVIGNCLLVSGGAPAVVIEDTGGNPKASEGKAASGTVGRTLRLLATTVISTQTAIAPRHDAADGRPFDTDIILRQSVLARQAGSANTEASAMVQIVGWPWRNGAIAGRQMTGLQPQADRSAFVGWPSLGSVADTIGQPGTTTDDWPNFWVHGHSNNDRIENPLAAASPETITPESVHAELATIVQPATGGQVPGLRPDEFAPLPTGLIQHVAAATRQPFEPVGFGADMIVAGEPVRFDLSLRRSLSRFLAGNSVPDGTHVIAFGSGLKEVDPIVIENKSIRLEFQNGDGSPLLIQPDAGRDGAPAAEAFITLRNATLDLVGINFKLPASRTFVYPKSFAVLEDAGLAVRNSQLIGPRVGVDAAAALIRTVGEGPTTQPRTVLIENSFAVGLAPILAGPVRWDAFIARNDILVSDTDAVVAGVSTAARLPAAIVMDHCTVSAGGAAIRADVDPAATSDGDPLTLYARACVFAGPLDGTRETSVVVAHSAGAAQNQSLVWWGSANGYSDRLAGSIIDGAGPPGDFTQDWTTAWGQGHEANPLTGKTDVLFRKPLPDLKDVEPTDFTLADSATAIGWGPLGESLGADVATIGPRTSASASQNPNGPSPGKSGTQRGKNNPGF